MRSASAKISAVVPCATIRPFGHHDHAVGVLRDQLHVVGDDQDRPSLVVELTQESQQLVGPRAVLPEGRFVQREHGRTRHQRGADGEAPLLAAGEQERVRLRLAGEPESREERFGAVADLIVGQMLKAQAVRDLVEHGVRDELVLGVLEDEADPRRECAGVGAADVESVDVDRAARRGDDPGDRLDETGLACAVRADDGNELAAADVEVDMMQDRAAPASE